GRNGGKRDTLHQTKGGENLAATRKARQAIQNRCGRDPTKPVSASNPCRFCLSTSHERCILCYRCWGYGHLSDTCPNPPPAINNLTVNKMCRGDLTMEAAGWSGTAVTPMIESMDLYATPTTNIPNINMVTDNDGSACISSSSQLDYDILSELLDEMPAAETRTNAGAPT
ncbi:hypothetical protein HK101_007179, partial [Irineochytrium annulatum]